MPKTLSLIYAKWEKNFLKNKTNSHVIDYLMFKKSEIQGSKLERNLDSRWSTLFNTL